MILALISHRFGFTSRWSVGPVDKSPFGRRFSIHGFAQILSLQQRFSLNFAAIDFSLHANYALIFGTRIARITRICCLVSKDSRDSRDSCSKINTQYYFLVAHGSHGSHGFFSLQATIRISPRLRLYYIISSYTYQFFEKCYICSPPQYRSALVVARMGEFILSNVPQISLNTQIFKIYQTIPNLFFSLLVRVSVVLSTSKMPWRSWEVKVPKYSPSINFFNGIEKSMPQSTKLSYFKNSG